MPLTILALVFLGVYGAPIIWTDLPPAVGRALVVANVVIWVIFALDLLARVVLSERRWRYLASHPIDLAIVVLPVLRPLRALRLLAVAQAVLQRGAIGGMLWRTTQLVTTVTILVALVAALTVLDVERDAEDANITTFSDALWWAATTVTTVGYGDRFPVTGVGRTVAVALMVVGIALVGVVTASVAAWFVHRVQAQQEQEVDETLKELRELRRLVDRLLTEQGVHDVREHQLQEQ